MTTHQRPAQPAPRYRPRRLRRPDEPLEWETVNPTRSPDRHTRWPARPDRNARLVLAA